MDAGLHEEDLGLVLGMGFPASTGGLTPFASAEGLFAIVSKLDELARRVEARFAPSDGLRRRGLHG